MWWKKGETRVKERAAGKKCSIDPRPSLVGREKGGVTERGRSMLTKKKLETAKGCLPIQDGEGGGCGALGGD